MSYKSGNFRYPPTIDKPCLVTMNDIWQNLFYFILFAMQPDAILYDTFNRVIGLQVLRNCRGLSPFDSNVIAGRIGFLF